MRENIFAHTDCSGVGYPGYVSINRVENGDVEITVRSSPTQRDGVHVCMNQPGPGNCTPGGPTCNNYCNLAPEKGPMRDHPLPCVHTVAGTQACFTIPAAKWERLRSN
jgi:hypothetical protein